MQETNGGTKGLKQSEQSEQKQHEEHSSHTPDSSNSNNTDKARMISLALIEGGMQYRKVHLDQDIDLCDKIVKAQLARDFNNLNFAKTQKIERQAKAFVLNYVQKQDNFTKVAGNYVADRRASEQFFTKEVFEESQAYRNVTIEIGKAKDARELLAVMQLYNMGHLDHLLHNKNENNNESSENTSNLVPTENDIAINSDGYHEPLSENDPTRTNADFEPAVRTPEHGC